MRDGRQHFGSESGTRLLYAIEARSTFTSPIAVTEKFILDQEWRLVPILPAIYGIHVRRWCPIKYDRLPHLVNEEAALALAHAFIANLHADLVTGSGCVEVRIVQVELKYSFSTEETGVGPILHRTDGEHMKFGQRETEPISVSARNGANQPEEQL